MGLVRQTWVLTKKNLLIVVRRHWFSTIFRALILPIIYIFIISYVRNFFLPPSVYGFGESYPIRSASAGFNAESGHDRVVLINNGFTGGEIESVINDLNTTYAAAGANVQVATSESDLSELCRTSLTGSSRCYGAVAFTSSPSEGTGPLGTGRIWAYTAYVDWNLGFRINVDSNDNPAQVVVLPLVRAVDSAIARALGKELPESTDAIPFTSQTLQEREDDIQQLFMSAFTRYLGLVVFIAICGITFHLPGQVARERELGMSSLIDIMNPARRQWLSHAARILATNISFNLIYLPGVLAVAGIISASIFLRTNAGMIVLFLVLSCISLAAFSTFLASFFRRAQLSGITIVIFSCILTIIAQWVGQFFPNLIFSTVMSVVFPPANFVFWTILVAEFESILRGASWIGSPRFSDFNLPPLWWFYAAAIVQTLVFPLLTLWSEKVRYGTSSSNRKVSKTTLNTPQAINLAGFTKTYYPGFWRRITPWKKAQTVYAVSDLTFAALRGQLVALLGRNGAGKSTTMAAITAQEKFTSGLIELDGGGGLGFCPQKNVMWDELTVLEHVSIFNQLKAGSHKESKAMLRRAIDLCDLATKVKAKSKTLSGGQKRKLQLAMAFTGGSRVCCVDEASSGLDPVSRRKIWDILLSERGHRTILFTTHALDEADALADHIVMMEQGKLTMEGSAVELKQRYGGDYQIISQRMPAGGLPRGLNGRQSMQGTSHIFHVADPGEAGRLVDFFEKQGIHDYEVNGPTIETVFLRQAEQDPDYVAVATKQDHQATSINVRASKIDHQRQSSTITTTESRKPLPEARKLSFLGQFWVLYRKRLTILPHNYVPYIFALVIPIVTSYLAIYFLSGFQLLVCSPSAVDNSPGSINSLYLFYGAPVPVGPAADFNTQQLEQVFGSYGTQAQLVPQDSYSDWIQYLQQNFRTVSPGGLFLGNGSSNTPTIAFRADGGLVEAAAVLSVSDAYVLQTEIASSFSTFALPIVASMGDSLQLIIYFGLAMSIVPGLFALYPSYERLRNIKALQYSNGVRPGPLWLAHLAFDAFFVVAISTAAVVIFTSIRAGAWYSAPHLWPVFFFYGLSATLFSYMTSLFFKTQLGAFAFAAGYQALTMLLYFFLYLILLAFSQADDLQSNLMVVQFTFGFITPSGNIIRALLLALNQSQIACSGQAYLPTGSPQVYGGPICLLILQIAGLFTFLVAYDGGHLAGTGTRIADTLFFWKRKQRHSGRRGDPEKVAFRHSPPADVLSETKRAEDSQDDALRVLHLSKRFGRSKEPVVDDMTFGVKHGEVYASLGPNGAGKTTTISLIRGTLKPTRTNDLNSDDSNIFINSHSLLHHQASTTSSPRTLLSKFTTHTSSSRTSALLSLGVCPQFDAIDMLTVRQHLKFYARAAGIPSRHIDYTVSHILSATGLTPLADRQAATLSGGNKRKLSLAIAVVGNPKVLLLDEPSSGMDAVSKRVMWAALQNVQRSLNAGEADNKGMAMVITSHSMEEVSVLADRVGIMKRRMLAVGSKRDLIRRFGDRWHVHLLLNTRVGGQMGPIAGREQEERVKRWIEHEVPGAQIEREMLHGQVRFWVPRRNTDDADSQAAGGGGLAEVFRLLEAKKEELGIEYYSVVQTNLEDVFLNVVGAQEDE